MKKLQFFSISTLVVLFATTSFSQTTAPLITQMDLQWSTDTAINANFSFTGNFPLTVTFVVSKRGGAQEKLSETPFTYTDGGFKQVYLYDIGTQDETFDLLVAIFDTIGNYKLYRYEITNSPFFLTTGIKDVDQKSISLFPNPCSNNLKITVEEDMDVKLLDITGRAVLAKALHTGSNSIATDNIPSGIYLATLTDSKGWVTTQRILKE